MGRREQLEAWGREATLRASVRTVARLAAIAGVPTRTAEQWVQGRRVPRLGSLLTLADGLGLPVERVARACAAARVRYLAARAAEQARKDALKG